MFSLKPILIKQAYELNISSEQVIALRMLFAMPFYIGVVWYQWAKNKDTRPSYRQHLLPIVMLGVLGYFIASYLDLLGLQYISAQLERVVLFCFPTLVVFMSFFFFKTELPKNIWIILGMSYGGILLIFAHDLTTLGSNVALGTGLVFLSAIAFAVYVLWSKPLMGKVGSQMFTSIAMLGASVAIFVYFVSTQAMSGLQVSNQAYLLIACLALFCTVIPSLLVAKAISSIGPERTSIVGTCGPVITSVLAVILLGEAFTIYHGAGIILIIAAVSMMLKKEKAAKI
jgi:drug/metabolite transporter (DMT)-like permease